MVPARPMIFSELRIVSAFLTYHTSLFIEINSLCDDLGRTTNEVLRTICTAFVFA